MFKIKMGSPKGEIFPALFILSIESDSVRNAIEKAKQPPCTLLSYSHYHIRSQSRHLVYVS